MILNQISNFYFKNNKKYSYNKPDNNVVINNKKLINILLIITYHFLVHCKLRNLLNDIEDKLNNKHKLNLFNNMYVISNNGCN